MPMTPSDAPSSPGDYAAVPVQPMDIQAPMTDVTPVFDAANAAAGAGVLYGQSARQAETQQVMESKAGFGVDGFAVDGGSSAGWPNNVAPGA